MPTLLEVVKDSSNMVERALVEIISERTPIMEMLPFIEVNGMHYEYSIEDSLPTVAARNIGGSYTANTGTKRKVIESLCIVGGEVRIDNFEVNLGGQIRDLKGSYYRAKARAMGLTFSEWFFEGDQDINPAQFDGLRKRLAGTAQVVNLASGGATLTLAALDQLIDTVVGGADALFMNATLKRKIYQLARDASNNTLLDRTTTALGKRPETYNGIPMFVIERDDNMATILDFDEDDGLGNMDTASIYAVKWGSDYISGLRGKGSTMTVKDFGEMEERPQHMGRIEAYWGLANKHPRAAARLTRINNA